MKAFTVHFFSVLISCVVLFSACKKEAADSNVIQSDTEITDSSTTADQSSNHEQSVSGKSYDEKGWDLLINEAIGDLKIGSKTEDILSLLGEPDTKGEIEYWEAVGLYFQEWKYPEKGVELYLASESEQPHSIEMITIKSPSTLKTRKGIGVGSSVDDVKEAYSFAIDPEMETSEEIIAGSYYGGIIFTLNNNTVQTIFMGAAAE